MKILKYILREGGDLTMFLRNTETDENNTILVLR